MRKTNLILPFFLVGFICSISAQNKNLNEIGHGSQQGIDSIRVNTSQNIRKTQKTLAFSSQQIEKENLIQAYNPNPLSALSGKISGMQVQGQNFNGSIHVRIRGNNSTFGNNQPLIVLDGIPLNTHSFTDFAMQTGYGGYDYGALLNDLNTFDIEKIDVLKGAAASALYGVRGQNGVIMLTSKNGNSKKDFFRIQFNTGVNVETVNRIPDLQNEYGAGYGIFDSQLINGKTYDLVNYSVDQSWGPKYDPTKQVIHWWGASDYQEGTTSTPQTGAWIAPGKDVAEFYETGVALHNALDITMSNQKSNLRIGYTNLHNNGTMPNSTQAKNNLNLNADTKLLQDKLQLQSHLNFIHHKTKGRPAVGYDNQSTSRIFYQWGQRQLDMDNLKTYLKFEGVQRAWNRISWDNPNPTYSDNPYWIAYENFEDDTRIRGIGSISANYALSAGLSISGNVAIDVFQYKQQERTAIGSVLQSYYGEATHDALLSYYELKLQYKKNFNEFSLFTQVGSTFRSDIYKRSTGESAGGLQFADQYDLSNSLLPPVYVNQSYQTSEIGVFGMVSLGWKDFSFLDFTYREDHPGATHFYRSAPGYFSIAGNVSLSDKINLDFINVFKIRANYAQTGNISIIAPIQTDEESVTTRFPNTIWDTNMYDAGLLPETTREMETGIDISLFKSRMGMDLTLYKSTTKNQILPLYSSNFSGPPPTFTNAGSVQNSGIEIAFWLAPVRSSDFDWNINVNYARNINRVLDLIGNQDRILVAKSPLSGGQIFARVGSSVQSLYAYDYIYDDEGNKVIDEKSGFYMTTGELSAMGSAFPDYTLGIQNSFRLKKVRLNILTEANMGGKYYSLSHVFGMSSGMLSATAGNNDKGIPIREALSAGGGIKLEGVNAHVIIHDDNTYTVSDTRPNTKYIKAIDYGTLFNHSWGTPSATSIYDASSIRIRELSLSYKLPQIFRSIHELNFHCTEEIWPFGRWTIQILILNPSYHLPATPFDWKVAYILHHEP